MNKGKRVYPALLQRARELRHPQTPAEATLWRALRGRNIDHKFRRQHPIERFIVDFYCAEAHLCIEVDGETHLAAEQVTYDAERTLFLRALGYEVIRFTNEDIRRNIHAVVGAILRAIQARQTLSLKGRGEG